MRRKFFDESLIFELHKQPVTQTTTISLSLSLSIDMYVGEVNMLISFEDFISS